MTAALHRPKAEFGSPTMASNADRIVSLDSDPGSSAQRHTTPPAGHVAQTTDDRRSAAVEIEYRLSGALRWLGSPTPYLMLIGFTLLLGVWYLSVEILQLPRFKEMPGLTTVFREWVSCDPTYGLSIHTPVYYQHILVSVRRVAIAFFLATVLGVPTGLLLGWSRRFRDYVFPVFEAFRPIPILA